jgi:hypothetical protein
MRQIARFWLLILSVTVGCLAFGYLFLSFATFIAPDIAFVTTDTNTRLLIIAVALVSLAVFVWAFTAFGGPEPESPPDADDDEGNREPTLGNRNR